mmetsp:Transcript_7011/g.26974  ORF Transcript_7011/g.26974 Transcript_7011/m.26974 type:complete len:167 (-) Transcript_7011:2-502(-)
MSSPFDFDAPILYRDLSHLERGCSTEILLVDPWFSIEHRNHERASDAHRRKRKQQDADAEPHASTLTSQTRRNRNMKAELEEYRKRKAQRRSKKPELDEQRRRRGRSFRSKSRGNSGTVRPTRPRSSKGKADDEGLNDLAALLAQHNEKFKPESDYDINGRRRRKT